MIKIAFFDIDGTLLRFNHSDLIINTIEALHRLQDNGILICIATGRSNPCVPHFNDVNFDVYLTFNGSYIFNKHEVIRSNQLDKDDVQIILSNLKSMGKPAAIANTETIVTNGIDDDLRMYFEFGSETINISKDFEQIANSGIYQIMAGVTKEEYDDVLKNTKHCKITAWWDRAVDIIPIDGGKGKAIEKILEHYGFSKDEAIGFGDGRNDIEMLKTVGLGIAMGNASDEVKSYADDVCESVDDDGIYKYCLKNNFFRSTIINK